MSRTVVDEVMPRAVIDLEREGEHMEIEPWKNDELLKITKHTPGQTSVPQSIIIHRSDCGVIADVLERIKEEEAD